MGLEVSTASEASETDVEEEGSAGSTLSLSFDSASLLLTLSSSLFLLLLLLSPFFLLSVRFCVFFFFFFWIDFDIWLSGLLSFPKFYRVYFVVYCLFPLIFSFGCGFLIA